MLPPLIRLQAQDPEMLSQAIRGADLKPCQFSARPAPSRLSRITGPQACLDFASIGPAMFFSGAMPADCFTLVYARSCPTVGRNLTFGIEHTEGYMGFFSPGGLLDAVTPAGYRNAALTIPAASFQAALTTAFPDIPEPVLARGAGMRVGAVEDSDLAALLDRCETMVWHSNEINDPLFRQNLERVLIAAFLNALRSGCDNLVPATPPRLAARHRRLRSAREFLAGHTHKPVYLDELCNAVGLSHRGMENLFQDLLGTTPLAYLKRERLHGARRALLRAQPGPGVVKRAAFEWGFVHLGRFARDYREFFGEGPAETAARLPMAR